MPRLDPASAGLAMSEPGALLGLQGVTIHDAARTDTHAGHGAIWFYTSGATIVFQVFDQNAGAWRSVSLT